MKPPIDLTDLASPKATHESCIISDCRIYRLPHHHPTSANRTHLEASIVTTSARSGAPPTVTGGRNATLRCRSRRCPSLFPHPTSLTAALQAVGASYIYFLSTTSFHTPIQRWPTAKSKHVLRLAGLWLRHY
jgi:hypothetical protein